MNTHNLYAPAWDIRASDRDRALTAYITAADGVPRRYALISTDPDDAREEALLLGQALFRSGFTYGVLAA